MTTKTRPRPGERGKATGSREEAALARVRTFCLALPETHEKEAWGAPTFRVRGRLFAMFVDDHHGDGRLAVWCTAPPVAQEALVAAEPEHFFVPPYVGTQGWVGVRLDTGLAWDVIAQRLEAAHGVSMSKGKVSGRARGAGATVPAPPRTAARAGRTAAGRSRRGARRRDT
jgi:hypothetical protein